MTLQRLQFGHVSAGLGGEREKKAKNLGLHESCQE